MLPTYSLTAEQQRYLTIVLNQSEDELLLEVARGSILGVTASAHQPLQTPESRERHRAQVPKESVSEYEKPVLIPLLPITESTVVSMRQRLYRLVCDSATLRPTPQAIESLTGSEKDFIAAVIGMMTQHFSTVMAVAIPLTVLLLKKGLVAYCATKPQA